jgi:cytochrome c553
MRVRVFVWIAVGAVLGSLALVGCGGDNGSAGDPNAGKKVFIEAGCGDCHTYADAGTRGQTGPNLDDVRPTVQQVETQVRNGKGLMPSFAGKLSPQEIKDVAQFVGGPNEGGPVVEEFKPDNTTLESCKQGDFACYEQALGNVAYKESTKAAVALLTSKQTQDPGLQANCHRIAHAIGSGTLLRNKQQVGPSMAEADAICWSGIYHGIVERAFADTPDDELPQKAREMCADPQTKNDPFAYYQCVHGLGHGLMIQTGYDLPKSLKICDQLQTAWDRQSCTSGIFMENISSSYGVKSKYLKDDDLVYPCNAVAERHKYYCYLMVTSRILEATGYNWQRAVDECNRVERNWVTTCFQSFGRDASGQAQKRHNEIIQHCRMAGRYEGECIYGVVRDITSNDASPKRAAKFCRQIDKKWRGRCFDGLGTILASLEPDRIEEACREVSGKYARDCMVGAGVASR